MPLMLVRKGLSPLAVTVPAFPKSISTGLLMPFTLNELVLGPATDGGYYLIGIKRPLDELFENIPWGTDRVFETTVSLAQQLGLSTEILEELHDVDRPEDLKHLDHNTRP